MEDTVYIVDAIVPEGKGKIITQEERTAAYWRVDENNNLLFEDDNGDLIYMYHNYNWKGVYPKSEQAAAIAATGFYCPASADHKCHRTDCVGAICRLSE